MPKSKPGKQANNNTKKNPSKSKSPSASKSKYNNQNEKTISKSAAEFFAENQNIAGFDNPGKSLYTTLRELIENSLDACESVSMLPDIQVKIEEMTQEEYNELRGIGNNNKSKNSKDDDGTTDDGVVVAMDVADGNTTITNDNTTKTLKSALNKKKKQKKTNNNDAYFKISVRDNGCGMSHDAIPQLLGRVLTGSKYGVRQTRGKFGLGAKMALIWSKKSTGIPITVVSSHMERSDVEEEGSMKSKDGSCWLIPGKYISNCVLDLDIYKNEPRIISHTKKLNADKPPFIGTCMTVLISGNWTYYKSRVTTYLQQLAIITPYARLSLEYINNSDSKKNMTLVYQRRSEQMPPLAKEVKHHPSSVNNLLIQQLIHKSNNVTNFTKFLTSSLSSITPSMAISIQEEIGLNDNDDDNISNLSDKHITQLVQILKSRVVKAPDSSCLSPLGEYNLNLGVQKVIQPDVIATFRDRPGAVDGHPFLIETAVALGGSNAKEGITVTRFANRIPLLFEAGADVVTRVALTKIKWSLYKMDHRRDKISVFCSIVSTKIPFKGTGKEYIGDDIIEIQHSVKRALQGCCQQLRTHLTQRNAQRDIKERKGKLLKYVPNVTNSIWGILNEIQKRKRSRNDEHDNDDKPATNTTAGNKRLRILEQIDKKKITKDRIKNDLLAAVEANNLSLTEKEDEIHNPKNGNNGNVKDKKSGKSNDNTAIPLFIVPMKVENDKTPSVDNVIQHKMFTFWSSCPITVLKD